MAKGDILNKLKIAGYVTSTDPSDAIEDELDIHGGSAEFPDCIPASSNGVIMGLDYVTTDDSNYSIESGSWAFKHNDEIVKVDLGELDDILSKIDESTLTLYDSYFVEDGGATIKAYDLPEELSVLSSFDPNKAGDVHYFETRDDTYKIWGLWDGGNKDELIGTYIPKPSDQVEQYVFYRVHEVQDPAPFINKLHVGFYMKDQQSPCLTKLINIILETSPDEAH